MTTEEGISAPDASALTERIREEAERTWALLAEAYDQGTWSVLGHQSWDDYVAAEFDVTASPAMRLLERAHLVPLDEAEPGPMELSESQARELVDQVVLSLQALASGIDMIDLSTLPSDPPAAAVVADAVTTLSRLAAALRRST